MLAIVNVSPENTPKLGPNQYEVRVNSTVLAEFKHNSKPNGAAQCLRDAAEAIERAHEERVCKMTENLIKLTEDGDVGFN